MKDEYDKIKKAPDFKARAKALYDEMNGKISELKKNMGL